MRLLLDTANLDDIKKFLKTGLVCGVTTNPSLMAKESKGNYIEKLCRIRDAILGAKGMKHLSVEVTTLDPEGMFDEACHLDEILKTNETGSPIDLHIKIPAMLSTMEIIYRLRQRSIQTNATACMTAIQAKLAQEAGATVVSFFYNRIADGQGDPEQVLRDFESIRGIRGNPGQTKIICGSIRKSEDIFKCWRLGVDYVTAGPKIIGDALTHPQTTIAIEKFQEDIEKWLS